jgi:hypothetical protein
VQLPKLPEYQVSVSGFGWLLLYRRNKWARELHLMWEQTRSGFSSNRSYPNVLQRKKGQQGYPNGVHRNRYSVRNTCTRLRDRLWSGQKDLELAKQVPATLNTLSLLLTLDTYINAKQWGKGNARWNEAAALLLLCNSGFNSFAIVSSPYAYLQLQLDSHLHVWSESSTNCPM